ncbi:MAG: restriction endonuclease subunit S, partial [Anaerolineae bacterium]
MIHHPKSYPAYKDSGVPWLEEVPAHWEIKRQRNVADLLVSNIDKHTVEGQVPVRLSNYVDVYKNDRITEHLSFMRATASPDEINRFRLQVDDVIITKDSEMWNDIGVPALVEYTAPDLVCGYHLAILRPRRGILHGSYLFRVLQSQGVASQYYVSANGVTRYGLSHDAIKSVLVPVPPPDEQAAIVRYLDHVDHRIRRYIRAKQKLIALLNEQKQGIIHQAVTRGLDPNVRLKPSGVEWLGEVPEHWQVVRSKRLFSARKELAQPDDVQLSATQAYGVIPQAEFEQKVARRVVQVFLHLDKRRHVEKDDFVISMRSFQGGLERAWVSGCIRSSYVVLKPTAGADIAFFSYLFKSDGYIKALQATANFIRDGQDLNFSNFCLVDLPSMPLDEQRGIADFLDQATSGVNTAIAHTQREISLLREYRTRLIADV